jgi:hypothetical protein
MTPLSRGGGSEGFLETIVFSDEVTFPLSVNVQRHGVLVWSDENPQEKSSMSLSAISIFVVY